MLWADVEDKTSYVKAWLCDRTWHVGVFDMMGAKGMIEGNEIGDGKSILGLELKGLGSHAMGLNLTSHSWGAIRGMRVT